MSPRAVAEAYFTALNAGDVRGAGARLSDDVEFMTPTGALRGREQATAVLEDYAAAFPDAQFEVTRALEAGSSVALEGFYRGTHAGPLRPRDRPEIPPTGRRVEVPFVTLFDVEGREITSHRAYWDGAGFMAQLGLMPGA
jgi:steroid delta-isomerase-like uncharacterized protein